MPHPTIHAVCLASSGRALSGTCSGPAAFVNNRKKTSLHESILSGIKARFGALARYAAALDEKAAARLSAADHPQQAAKQLETLLRLPETGTLLHFEAGDGGFLEAFHAARPGWELSAIESGDAFMRLLKKRSCVPPTMRTTAMPTSLPGSTSSPLPSLWMKWRSLSTPSAG